MASRLGGFGHESLDLRIIRRNLLEARLIALEVAPQLHNSDRPAFGRHQEQAPLGTVALLPVDDNGAALPIVRLPLPLDAATVVGGDAPPVEKARAARATDLGTRGSR
jgi:hypothetical protein